MSLALATAKAAAHVALEALSRGVPTASALSPYEAQRQEIVRHYVFMTRALLLLSRHRRLAGWLVKRLGRRPRLFSTLLGINCGEFGPRDIPPAEVVKFLLGV
jgi:hypothetical protein